MILLTTLWSIATSAPLTLDNGVVLDIARSDADDGWIEAAWTGAHGTAHTAPGATATALMALRQGTHAVPAEQAVSTWVTAVGGLPTPLLGPVSAGETLRLRADRLEAWAWLTSDRLHDPLPNDLPAAYRDARLTWTEPSPLGASAWSWPATAEPLPDAVVGAQIDRLRDPRQLTLTVRGDVDVDSATLLLRTAFSSLSPTAEAAPLPNAPAAEASTRDRYEAAHDRVVVRVPLDEPPPELLSAARDELSALATSAWQAEVAVEDGPHPALLLRATPAPHGHQRVLDAWRRALRRLAAELDRPALASAPWAVLREHRRTDDPEVTALATTYGPMTAELVRLRLRALDQTPTSELAALIRTLRAERERMPAELRPALDLVLQRAEARQ